MARASVPSTSISPSPCSRIFPRRPRAGTGRRAVRAPRARSDGDVGDGGEDAYAPVSEEELRAAVEECRELLREATRMAGEQARAELTASFLSVPEGASGLTGNLAVDMARVQLFFQGKGMRAWEAEKTSRTLVELDSIYGDVELLAVKYDRLVSTLPDVDVKAMVANDPSVMGTEIKSNVERMLRLGDIFPARKVPRLLAEAPKLLTCGDLEDRVARTVDCIKRVYPKETDESCMYAVRETNRQSREKIDAQPAEPTRVSRASRRRRNSEATDPFDRTRSSPFPLPPSSRAVERGAEFTVRPSGSERIRETHSYRHCGVADDSAGDARLRHKERKRMSLESRPRSTDLREFPRSTRSSLVDADRRSIARRSSLSRRDTRSM